jgi:N-acetylglucosaminyldiphosphoundecaprenol N-acetyl-beta-D-mannosaminyltransferase
MTVLSGAPEETYRNYGYSSVPRMEMKAVDEAISKCDALVFAGGSIFQDVTSVKSVAYYSQLVKKAKKAGKRVVMVGQGVGPLTSFFGKKMAASAFNMADAIVVRDPTSMTTLKNLGVKVPTKVGADCAFLMPDKVANEDVANFTVGNMKTVGLSLRPNGKDTKSVIELFGELCRLLFSSNFMPVLIEMDRNVDGPLIQEISKKQGGKIPDLRKQTTPMQLQGRFSRMDAIIAMRLHAGILATTVGIPPLMVNYDPKVAAFAKMLDIGQALPIENLTPQRLFDSFVAFQRDRERNLKIVQRKRDELRKLAEINIQAVTDMMGSRTR